MTETPRAIPAIAKDQLVLLNNSEYAATVGACGLVCHVSHDDGTTTTRPSEAGDVLSVQPDGTLQTRPEGTTGSFERAIVSSAGLVYRPKGADGGAYLVPLVNDWPNK